MLTASIVERPRPAQGNSLLAKAITIAQSLADSFVTSNRYRLFQGASCIAEVGTGINEQGWITRADTFDLGGAHYRIHQQGVPGDTDSSEFRGDFILSLDSTVLGRATSKDALRSFEALLCDKRYSLTANGFLGSPFAGRLGYAIAIEEDGVPIGKVVVSLNGRECAIDLPEEVPMPAQVFLFWLSDALITIYALRVATI